MRTIKPEPLSVEAFLPFGRYQSMINPEAVKIGASPIEFFRDMVPLKLGADSQASFSVCRVESREMIIDTAEHHSATGEGIMPLDGDVLIHVGPATPLDQPLPLDCFRVFEVPRNTFVALDPGVWHHAPFTKRGAPVNCLIVLPMRTYALDCKVMEIPKKDRILIES